eukprot:CAMPEP_0183505730 /NCGR_PEP_ID=MMETSP0371-20130417/6867_1 /TAXON_ID=268820 /ORGANISM="Peridinium aciculiferum, Strain PAER-2" /LENGTH=30 /DNA_ID= /DNA_START= /DNA_END= /DNA_ORIENTATION=
MGSPLKRPQRYTPMTAKAPTPNHSPEKSAT